MTSNTTTRRRCCLCRVDLCHIFWHCYLLPPPPHWMNGRTPHHACDPLLRNWERDRRDRLAAASIPQAEEDEEEEGCCLL
jgi:hypothetical protein